MFAREIERCCSRFAQKARLVRNSGAIQKANKVSNSLCTNLVNVCNTRFCTETRGCDVSIRTHTSFRTTCMRTQTRTCAQTHTHTSVLCGDASACLHTDTRLCACTHMHVLGRICMCAHTCLCVVCASHECTRTHIPRGRPPCLHIACPNVDMHNTHMPARTWAHAQTKTICAGLFCVTLASRTHTQTCLYASTQKHCRTHMHARFFGASHCACERAGTGQIVGVLPRRGM